jgi:Sulfotransferase family
MGTIVEGPVCIIGMHRSGTSMVARLLQQAGLYLGPEDRLLSPDSANPDGHFEHTGFLEINNALLQRLGDSWDVPPRMEAGWELDASLEDIRDKARSLVTTFQDKSPWGWKEPRTTILLPFWNSIISNLRFVICVRSPLDVAKSLTSRNQMPIDYGVYLWNRYMHAAIHGTAGYPRCLTFYEHFFGDGVAETRRLLEFCRLECTSAQSVVESEIRSELRHHNTGIPELLDESSVLSYPKLLYIGLRALSACGSICTAPGGESNRSIGEYLKLLDEFHNQAQLGQLEIALSGKTRELKEKNLEITTLKNQLNDLQQYADRLQKFSDAVRQTWAYRVYRNLIKPFHSK